MGDPYNPGDPDSRADSGLAADEARLEQIADELVAAIEASVAGWVTRCVTIRCAQAGMTLDEAALAATGDAADRAADMVTTEVRSVLSVDIDRQPGSPLEVLRSAVRYPTGVLRRLGVPPVVRDDFDVRQFPGDDYALTPASFEDVDESLHEPGLRWGAAKAHVHLARRRAEGTR